MLAQTIQNSKAVTLVRTFDYTVLNSRTDVAINDSSSNANGPCAKNLRKSAQYEMGEATSASADLNQKMGPELSEIVVQPFLNIYREPSDENILKEKIAAYPCPANVKTLRVPRLNSWLNEIATEDQKQQDWDLQNVQGYMVATMSVVAAQAQTMDNLKQWSMNSINSDNSDKTHIFAKSYESLMDANNFMSSAMYATNQFRRKLIKQGMADSFMELLNANKSTPDWLAGVDNSAAIPEINCKNSMTDKSVISTEDRLKMKSAHLESYDNDDLARGQEIPLMPSPQEDSKDNLGISSIDAELFDSLEFCGMMGNEKREDSESDGTAGFSPTLSIQVDRRSDRVERPHVCSECGKMYKYAGHLESHIKRHKACRQSGNLRTHLMTHTGQKPHVCSVCHKGFSHALSLTTHMATHKGEKGHRCSDCGQMFRNNEGLLMHSYTKHKHKKADKCTKGFSKKYEVISVTEQTKGDCQMLPQSCNFLLSQSNTLRKNTDGLVNENRNLVGKEKSHVVGKDVRNHYVSEEEQCDSESNTIVDCQPSSPVDQLMTDIDGKMHVGNSMTEEFSQPLSANYERKNYTGKQINMSNQTASISLCQNILDCRNTSQNLHVYTDPLVNLVYTESPEVYNTSKFDNVFTEVNSEAKDMIHPSYDDESVGFEKDHKLLFLTGKQLDNSKPDGAEKHTLASVPKVYKYRAPGERPHVCAECGKGFKQTGHLKDHMRTHTGEKPYACSHCGKRFSVSSHLKVHMRTHTRDASSGKPVCADCGKRFSCLSTLKNHIRIHTGEKPHVCTYCARAFSMLSTLHIHTMTHTGEKPFVCKYCGNGYRTSSLLKIHIRSHPAGNCPDCGQNFSSMDSIDAHLKTHRNNKSPDTQCSICNMTFSTPASLRTHICTDPGEVYVCTDCDKKFSTLDNLKAHMTFHTGENPHICSHCGEGFSQYDTLQIHVMSHAGEKSFECKVCGMHCMRSSLLKTHMKTHAIQRHNCTDCGKLFRNLDLLKTHMMNHTDEVGIDAPQSKEIVDGPHICPQCSREFKHAGHLRTHIRRHTGGKPPENGANTAEKPVCPDCGQAFSSLSALKHHLRTHTGEKPHVCSYCARAFSMIATLRIHMMTHTGEKPFVCKDCGKAFRTSGLLKIHIRSHPTGNCPHCGERFSNMYSLDEHLKTHRLNKPRGTVCTICNKTFSTPGSLRVHMRIHTGEKSYLCPECGKTFSANNSLRNHMRIHTGEKPNKCSYCGNAYNEPGQLIKHVRIHTGERPYKCSECGKGFRASGGLKDHIRVHTGEKPYVCSDCGMKFSTQTSLRRHERLHTGVLPHACPQCGKGFNSRYHVKEHMRTHTGEKPYMCPSCGRQFSDSGSLKNHMTRIHT